MTTFAESETRMRRMLRDPNGDIWSSMDLQTYFNDAQSEIAQKTNLLVRVEAHYYPPRYDYSYTYDWETGYLQGDQFQCLMMNQPSRDVICYPWENNFYLSTNTTEADGDAFTHPWEIEYVSNVANPPGILLHAQFDKMRFIAYDQEKIDPTTEKELQDTDRYYRSTTGQVTHYWRPDSYSNLLYLYPRPSTVTIQAPAIEDTFQDAGGINSSAEAWLDEVDTGIITDVVDTEDALLSIYNAIPVDIEETTEESSFPDFIVKYVEYATLERAYGADTDGFIPSLRDYWKQRKELGIQALKRFQRMSLGDRDYRLGGAEQPNRSKRLRFPEGYPAI